MSTKEEFYNMLLDMYLHDDDLVRCQDCGIFYSPPETCACFCVCGGKFDSEGNCPHCLD